MLTLPKLLTCTAYVHCLPTLRLILTLRALLTNTVSVHSVHIFPYVHPDCIAKVHAASIDDVRDHSLIRQVNSL